MAIEIQNFLSISYILLQKLEDILKVLTACNLSIELLIY